MKTKKIHYMIGISLFFECRLNVQYKNDLCSNIIIYIFNLKFRVHRVYRRKKRKRNSEEEVVECNTRIVGVDDVKDLIK